MTPAASTRLAAICAAVLLALGPAACGTRDGDAVPRPDPGCDQQGQRDLDAAPVLAVRPADAEVVDREMVCDDKDLPYAEHLYFTNTTPQDVIDFYQSSLEGLRWKIRGLAGAPQRSSALDSDDLLCASATVQDAPAYLELWYPDDSSGLLAGHPETTVYGLYLSRYPQNPTACGYDPARDGNPVGSAQAVSPSAGHARPGPRTSARSTR